MMNKPLPPELAAVWGTNADLVYRGNDEWSSACPYCNPAGRGGRDPSDRFRMFNRDGPPRGWCRSCDIKMFARSPGQKITEEQIQQARASHYKWLQEENRRLRDKIRWLKEQDFWRRWHEDMGEEARELWHNAGIGDPLIEKHKLGYTIERFDQYGGALSIPYIHYNSDGAWDVQTIQFRLLVPPDEGDKYRFIKGTKANWFYPWPHDTIQGVVLVTEGAKKAMVLWQAIANLDSFTYHGVDVTVVASPSKYVPNRMLKELDAADMVILMLDPDAYDRQDRNSETVVERNASIIGVEKCRHIPLRGKIDDLINNKKSGIDGKWIQSAVSMAEPVILYDPNRRPTTKHL